MSVARKQLLKNAVYGGLGTASLVTGATRLRAARLDAGLRVLMYHKVNDLPGNTLSVPPRLFRRQMELLRESHDVITPAQLLATVTEGRPLPPRAVLLTFDDGYRDNFTDAYPVLRELGLTALLFLATDYIGQHRVFPHDEGLPMYNPTLEWSHVEQMRDVFTVGSHGCSHTVLTRLPREEATREISESKQILEQHTGQPVHFFSYPKGSVGHYDEGHTRAVEAAGYLNAFITVPGVNDTAALRPGQPVRRYNVEPFGEYTYRRLLDGSCDAVRLKDTRAGATVKRRLNRALGTVTR